MPVEWACELQEKLYHAAKADRERRFHSLRDKLWRDDILLEAWESVRRNRGVGGVDQVTIAEIEEQGVQRFLDEVSTELRTGTYRANMVRRAYIPKKDGGQRPLGIPTIKDRVVQAAVRLVVEPIFEADFEDSSYGYRPNRSARDACLEIYKWLNFGLENVIDADIEAYFDSIPHDRLMAQVEKRIADGYVLRLIHVWLRAGILEERVVVHPERGTPQGGVISPLLANIYLHQLDGEWRDRGMNRRSGYNAQLVRYADDFVILSSGPLEEPLEVLEDILARLELRLSREKTHLIDARKGFDFLGFRFVRRYSRKRDKWVTYMFPSHGAMVRVKGEIRKRTDRRLQAVLTPKEVVESLNRLLHGWTNYYSHTHAGLSFRRVQYYCNRKLRRFLRSRRQKRGFGYKELPDEFLYKELGLEQIPTGRIRYVMP